MFATGRKPVTSVGSFAQRIILLLMLRLPRWALENFNLAFRLKIVDCFIAFTSESLDYILTFFFLEMSTCYTYMFFFYFFFIVISQCRIFVDLLRTKEIISKMFI